MRGMRKLKTMDSQSNIGLKMMNNRLGTIDLPHYMRDTVENADLMETELLQRGGFAQQRRMIRDKRTSLDRAMVYSYQGALVRKFPCDKGQMPVRALINPNKLKMDYDDKILSTRFENGFKPGDIFEWCNTRTYWIVYLQDLEELAYFRGNIRKCCYEIAWEEEDGVYSTYVAVRGPVETKINYIQKHGISVDNPNWSLNIIMPKNEHTMTYFRRYSKFYLRGAENPDDKICWRVEAVDSISTPGILEVNATEYYANETEDDLEEGLVGALITKIEDPNEALEEDIIEITGETFIRPKKEYCYYIDRNAKGEWYIASTPGKLNPVKLETFRADDGRVGAKVTWVVAYSGQFDLCFGDKNSEPKYKKTIVVESLF